jgi:vanillate O-demethylase monooxygenase subunit
MGDSRLADPAKIPDLSYIDEVDQWRTVYINMPVDFRHDILVDNLLDISHADYLHHGSFSGGPPKSGFTEVFEEENSVLIVRRQQDCPPLVGYGHLGRTDLEIRTRWHPGHVLTFEVHVLPINSGSEPTIIRFAQAITPETERTTHYFMAHSRDQDLENPALDRKMVEEQTAFILAEDVPMLRAVDTEMAGKDLLSMRPVVLPVDKGALLVRRKLKKLINEELPRK